MLQAHGLHGHIRNNNLKSLVLLGGYLLIVQLMMMAVWSICICFLAPAPSFEAFVEKLLDWQKTGAIPILVASLTWLAIALLRHKSMTEDLAGLQSLQRNHEPRLFNIVENLAISLGLPMPNLEISESQALNAYAIGLTPEAATIGVTRGLLRGLNDRELTAVIAHEFSHIRNNDTRLITMATIFCGMVFFMGWTLTYRARELWRQSKIDVGKFFGLTMVLLITGAMVVLGPWRYGLILAVVAILGSMFLSLALRFAVFRTREFVADGEAIEFTKDPEALISALLKVEGRNVVEGCDVMLQGMMISATAEGIYATHPSIESRIDAIADYAAKHLRTLRIAPSSERYIEKAPEASLAMGFSITAMKYPAWISKPLIVVPSMLTGYLAFALMQNGVDAVLATLLDLPNIITSTLQAEPSMIHVTNNGSPPPKGNAFENFGRGDVMGMLGTMAVALPLVLMSKLMQKLGWGGDSDFFRSLTGQPSKVMQGDYEEEKPTAKLSRLNMAMDRAAQDFRAPVSAAPRPTANDTPLPSHTAPRVFGKR